MKFLEPNYLLFALFPFLLALYFIFKRRKPRASTRLPLAVPDELIRRHSKIAARRLRALLLGFLMVCTLWILAAARPYFPENSIKRWAEGIDIMLVMDVSESMDATDFLPNRLVVAKKVIREFIEKRSYDRIGLVIFAGEAVTKCPLTSDYSFLLSQLEDVKLRELAQGTAIGVALANGVARLRGSQAKSRTIILFTDGDNNVGSVNPITAAHLAKEESIRVYSIGIGRDTRVVVPIFDYDEFGNRGPLRAQVASYLNPELLHQISRIANGKSYMATSTGALEKILAEIDGLEKSKVHLLPEQKQNDVAFPFAASAVVLLLSLVVLQETRFRKGIVKYAVEHR